MFDQHRYFVGADQVTAHNAYYGPTPWILDPRKDLDWRGTGHTLREALNEAFTRTGVPRDQFVETKWAPNEYGKEIPVEYTQKGGSASVNIDLGHRFQGPGVPHVGWQNEYKGSARVKGHILLDDVPANRIRR